MRQSVAVRRELVAKQGRSRTLALEANQSFVN